MLDVRPTELPDVLEIRPRRVTDDRGFFSEVWNQADWRAAGLDIDFVQDNHSASGRGVLRGLHHQLAPHAQTKLVRVSRGAIFDVAVDIRSGSTTFGRWIGRVLSAESWNQLLIPAGFAHGFLALEDGTEVQYKVTVAYSAAHDRAISPTDPAIGIDWPLPPHEWILSTKDLAAPLLRDSELAGA
jgi:dTDP-4-dehydrorhamnose 3,5-epimerase